MSMGRGGLFGNPQMMPWDEDIERQRQRMEAEMAQGAPQQQVPAGGLLGQQQPQQGFWQGGDKFRARDGIAGILAVIGDAIAANRGSGSMGATQNLMGGRMDAMEEAKKRAAEQAKVAEMMAVGERLGMRPEQVQAQMLGLNVPEQNVPPMVRDVEAWQRMTPEQKRAANEMYSARSPWRVMGRDGMPYQMNGSDGMPDFIPDDEMGGGTGNGAGGFRYPR